MSGRHCLHQETRSGRWISGLWRRHLMRQTALVAAVACIAAPGYAQGPVREFGVTEAQFRPVLNRALSIRAGMAISIYRESKITAINAAPRYKSSDKVMVSVSASLNERLLCIADWSTGYKFDQGNWSIRNFHVRDQRYVVAPLDTNSPLRPQFNYQITRIGEAMSDFNCHRRLDISHLMGCGSILGTFSVNFQTLRFQHYFVGSYLQGSDNSNADTPFLTIGKCSIF